MLMFNGAQRKVAAHAVLAALIRQESGDARGCAAAVDGDVVPRSEWDSFTLRDGQVIELVTAAQGG